jgi:hypothetical protein
VSDTFGKYQTFNKVECINQIFFSVIDEVSSACPVPIWLISHNDVDRFTSDYPYGLWIAGNENHQSFDEKFKQDPNCLFIVKPYPYIKNYSPIGQSYRFDKDLGKYFVETCKEDPRVLNIPLGPTKKFKNQTNGNCRNIDLGFIGQVSGIRQMMISNLPRLEAQTYRGFGIHRDVSSYSDFLSRCKASFCPAGHSPETYRLFESSISGCAVFGNPLPDTEYYLECPAVTIPWQLITPENKESIERVVQYTIENFDILSAEMKSWAMKWTSPERIYKIVKNHIEKVI